MMAELEYSGTTKPMERARRDASVEDALARINAPFAPVEIVELSPFMRVVAEDYFRPCGPSLTECYRRGLRIAAKHEFATVSLSTARRVIRSMVCALGADQYRKPDRTSNDRWLALAKFFGEAAAARINALYPSVEDGRVLSDGAATQAVSHLSQAAQQNVHLRGVVGNGHDGGQYPRFNQEGQLCVGWFDFIHGDSFQNVARHNATAGTASCEGGAE